MEACIGFIVLLIVLGVSLKILTNKLRLVKSLRHRIIELEAELEVSKLSEPNLETEIIWNSEGGYKIVPKNMTTCFDCGHSYGIHKMTRDREGYFYCPECAGKRIDWANWAIKQLKEINEKSETVSVE